ncbi:hypothetical protein M2G63_17870, partial [Vibrio vulnificus]|nr:hypothetical protein [Vibrio vulnificus]
DVYKRQLYGWQHSNTIDVTNYATQNRFLTILMQKIITSAHKKGEELTLIFNTSTKKAHKHPGRIK